MKRIRYFTVGQWRADYRRMNHVERRRFWQRILNPNPRHRPRHVSIEARELLIGMSRAPDGGILVAYEGPVPRREPTFHAVLTFPARERS